MIVCEAAMIETKHLPPGFGQVIAASAGAGSQCGTAWRRHHRG